MWLKQKGFNSRTATMAEINNLILQATAEEHLLDLDSKGVTPKVRESSRSSSGGGGGQ